MLFEWNECKNRSNKKKHGLSFETAALAFQDPGLVSVVDDRHHDEVRWSGLGLINGTVIYIAFTAREEKHDEEETIRIISARAATPSEERHYFAFQKSH